LVVGRKKSQTEFYSVGSYQGITIAAGEKARIKLTETSLTSGQQPRSGWTEVKERQEEYQNCKGEGGGRQGVVRKKGLTPSAFLKV